MKLKYTLLALAAVTGAASAATISVNFTEDAGRANQQIDAAASAGLAGYEAINWNNVGANVAGPANNLNDSDGIATTASVSWSGSGVWGDAAADTDANAGVGDGRLARGYIDDGANTTIDVTGITYTTYTAVLYFSTDVSGNVYNDATVNTGTYSTTGTKSQYTNPNWNATNTIVVTGLSGDLDIDLLARNGDDRGSIAGFQIIDTTAVPEPSSTALLGLGGLALIMRRRK